MTPYRIALTGAIVAALLLLPLVIFSVARALNEGEIAPNVNAAGVELGGLSEEDALAAMRAFETALRETPAPFSVNEVDLELDPRIVGTAIDEQAAVAQALELRKGGSFIDQFSAWLRSFRSPIVIDVPVAYDERAVTSVLDSWEVTAIGEPAHEGGVSVVDGVAVPDYPVAGVGVNREQGQELIVASISSLDRPRKTVPLDDIIPSITDADVDEAVAVANQLISEPVVLAADDPAVEVEFPTEILAEALRSQVVEASAATVELSFDPDALMPVLEANRESIVQPPRDARFVIGDGDSVSLEASRDGTRLDPLLVAERLAEAAAGDGRGEFPFRKGDPASFTTDEANAMSPIRRLSSSLTNFAAGQARVTNIEVISEAVNGAIVWPGQTFSLNDYVGPRTEAKGYVAAPMILRGEFVDEIGGGVSQFATTLYNAIFYSCLEVVEHKPHSYYFDRYPEGIEATISWPEPDLVFRNNTDALVIIRSGVSSTAVQVKIFGNTEGRECTGSRSDRYNQVDPEVDYETDRSIPPGSERVLQAGAGGWTVDITRTITMPDGTTNTQEWSHTYQPMPRIIGMHPCSVPGSSVACPVQVPNVKGLTFSQATARLEEAGLFIGDGGTTEVSSAGQDGLVQSQSTGPGEYADRGSVIRVVIGRYTAPPTTTQPPDTTTTTEPPGDDG